MFNVFFLGLNHAKYETRRRTIRKGIVFIRDSLPISLPHTLCMRRIDILLHNLLPTTPEFKFFIFETKRSMTLSRAFCITIKYNLAVFFCPNYSIPADFLSDSDIKTSKIKYLYQSSYENVEWCLGATLRWYSFMF